MSRVHSDRGLMNTNMKWKIKHHFNTAGNHSDCNKLRDRTFPTTKNSLIRLKWFSKLNYNKRMAKCWTSFACVPGSCLGPLACVPGGVLHDSPSMCYPEPNDLCPYPHGRAAFDSTGHPTEVMMGNCPTLQCKLHWFCLGPPVCLDYLPPPPPSKQASKHSWGIETWLKWLPHSALRHDCCISSATTCCAVLWPWRSSHDYLRWGCQF